ncbi:hypothetical protein Agabi119p4_9428 [Agaricus bisporus var. burnettii]|uniref:Uncharacterized protein n=1 Tax=Agaricus bisporus var. burnettii TaxID=192524 RepID=A0A8H7C3R5_AGABI|nr:hypothetical protein Agabi119p4_9428 [Agaricus bisporus var. burnettii]
MGRFIKLLCIPEGPKPDIPRCNPMYPSCAMFMWESENSDRGSWDKEIITLPSPWCCLRVPRQRSVPQDFLAIQCLVLYDKIDENNLQLS